MNESHLSAPSEGCRGWFPCPQDRPLGRAEQAQGSRPDRACLLPKPAGPGPGILDRGSPDSDPIKAGRVPARAWTLDPLVGREVSKLPPVAAVSERLAGDRAGIVRVVGAFAER
ncbi:hypothetical protein M446_5933 [Methylobacterium sp. 4-46]|nr:hypothetical protein M446_5933 [Methylobacterium sp. 4-46]